MRKKFFGAANALLAVCVLAGCGGGSGGGSSSPSPVLTRSIVGAFTATLSRAANDTLDVDYVLDSTGTVLSGSLRVSPANSGAATVGDFSSGVWNSLTKHLTFSATVGSAVYTYDAALNDTDTSQEVSTIGTLTYTPTGGTAVTQSALQFRKFANFTPNLAGNWTGNFTAPTASGGNGTMTIAFTQAAGSGVLAGSGSVIGTATATGAISGSLIGSRFDFSLTTTNQTVFKFTTNSLTGTQVSGVYTATPSGSSSTVYNGSFLLNKQ